MLTPPWLKTVHHDGSEDYASPLTPALGDSVRIRLRVGVDAPLRRVYLRTYPNGEQAFTPMTPAEVEPPARWFEVRMPITEPMTHYRFLLQAEDGIWWFTAAGPAAHEPLDATDFRILADYNVPEWLAGAVFYQIFPDSFANGDPSNDPQPGEYEYRGERPFTLGWGDPLPSGRGAHLAFYGGDLQGIVQKLDYLQGLGVNALYLNPIFTALSVHRYDTTDYEQVDPHLGGDEALIALRAALDARGMRMILDIVPNHCGSEHRWFRAAQADASAPEVEFFTFTHHPDQYESWLGHKSLVKLNYQSPELRHRMYEDENAVVRRWLREPYRADGWRIDVANMLGRQDRVQLNAAVARGIRQAVKTTRPDAYLIAENFYDASSQLQGDQWDGVMNYMGFALPLWNWLNGYETGATGLDHMITSPVPYPTAALEATWRQCRAAIPWAVTLQQYNLLDSHDTPRIRSQVGITSDALHKLAVILQMTLPGVPGIYYGDEIGMMDEKRPYDGSRGTMIWDETRQNRDLLTFYRQIIALRKESQVLQRGGLQVLAVEPDMLAYQRDRAGARAIVIAQRSATPRPAGSLVVAHGGIPDGTRFVEVFTRQECMVTDGALPLPKLPQGATLWMSE